MCSDRLLYSALKDVVAQNEAWRHEWFNKNYGTQLLQVVGEEMYWQRQGSTTLQCALRFSCPRAICTEVFKGQARLLNSMH
jgi:hypothetical protein